MSASHNLRRPASAFGNQLAQAADAAAARALLNPFPRSLFDCRIPFIMPSSGSMANNGAVTLSVALPAVFPESYVYFPANAIVAGSAAGWYFTVFSSTTVGSVKNNLYDPSLGLAPTVPGSPTAFVTTGPGAFTAVITTQQGPTFTLPANTIGIAGKMTLETACRATTDATNKAVNWRFLTTSVASAATYNATLGGAMSVTVKAQGATNRQVVGAASPGSVTQPAQTLRTFDMTAAQVVNVALSIGAAATDNLVLLYAEAKQDA